MGYGRRNNAFGKPTIQTYWPDDIESKIYVQDGLSLATMKELILEKWPGADLDRIYISPEHIQTDCLSYDLHDPSDYTDFLEITNMAMENE